MPWSSSSARGERLVVGLRRCAARGRTSRRRPRARGRRPAARAAGRRAWRGSAPRTSSTCSSSPQAAAAARCTKVCGATPDVGPVALQRGDQLGIAGREARAVAGHRRALGERVEDEHVAAVGAARARSAAGRRRTTAPSRPRRMARTNPRRARQRCRALEELERCARAGRVVGVVQPQQREVVGQRVEIGQPAVVGTQRELRRPPRRRTAPRARGRGSRGWGRRPPRPGRRRPGRGRRRPPWSPGWVRPRCRGRASRRSAAVPTPRSRRASRAGPRPWGRRRPARPRAPRPAPGG